MRLVRKQPQSYVLLYSMMRRHDMTPRLLFLLLAILAAIALAPSASAQFGAPSQMKVTL